MFKEALSIWLYFYHFHTKENFLFSAKDGAHLKQLLNKVKAKVQESGQEPTEENILNGLKAFLNAVKDKWILEHLEVAIVNSKFNVLFTKAKQPINEADRLNALIEARYGTKGTAAS